MPTIAKYDYLIDEMYESGLYTVKPDGSVWLNNVRVDKVCDYDIDSNKYRYVTYKVKKIRAHRVVYRFVNGVLDSTLEINHKNANKLDNSPDNIELINKRGNSLHAHYLGLLNSYRGKDYVKAKSLLLKFMNDAELNKLFHVYKYSILSVGSKNVGSKNGMAVLNEHKVIIIRRLYGLGMFQKDLSFLFNVSRQTINDVVNNVLWKHVV